MRLLFVFLWYGLMVVPVSLFAQSTPAFTHFTPQNGLPSSEVYQVVCDQMGYLWFATDHGLARYNGYEFKRYSSADGLTDNTVFKLSFDENKQLWMQTFSGRLFYMKNDRLLPYKFNDTVVKLVRNSIPLSFYMLNGELYFTTTFREEFKVNVKGEVTLLNRFGDLNTNAFTVIRELKKNVFVTSANNVIRRNQNYKLILKEFDRDIDTLIIGYSASGHIAVTRLRSGILMFVLGNTLFKYADRQLQRVMDLPVLSNNIYEDQQGKIWISTYAGVVRLTANGNTYRRELLIPDAFVSCVTEDHEGSVWVTTVNDGVYYYRKTAIQTFPFTTTPMVDPMALASDGKFMYAGFWNGYLLKMTAQSYEVYFKFPESMYMNNISIDTVRERIYLAKYLPGYIEKDKFITMVPDSAFGLIGKFLQLPNGDVLNPTVNGLYLFRESKIVGIYALDVRANYLFLNKRGDLLIAANSGLFSFDLVTGKTKLFIPQTAGKRVEFVSEVAGDLCLAIRGEGILIIHDGKLMSIDEKSGLCSNFINRMVANGNTLWCSSSSGLSKIVMRSGNLVVESISNYNQTNGLPDDEVNDLCLMNDTVWVATKTAISFFPASSYTVRNVPPMLSITALKVNNEPYSWNDSIALGSNENNLSVFFQGISPLSGNKILYKYYLLSGRDTFSSTTSSRHVDFPALEPGEYIFKVFAQNIDGAWSVNPAVLYFEIEAPVWKKWWFIIAVSAILGLFVYYLFRLRIRRVRKEEEWKAELDRQLLVLESKALRAQMNPHFIFNVMNSIQDYILKNDSKSAQRYLTKFARLVRMILDNSLESEVLLVDELKANILYVELEQQRFNDKFDFRYEVDPELETRSIRIPPMLIQPFLENAIKHGIGHLQRKGILLLKASLEHSDVVIVIEDNGVGRKAAGEWSSQNVKDHHSYGSLITGKRVEALNTMLHLNISLNVEDLMDDKGLAIGTRVVLRFPGLGEE